MATHHVIIGGGPVATNAMETIREFDGDAEITLLCDEPAHSRMAMPYWLSGQVPREHTHTADDQYFQQKNVNARIGVRATAIDPQANSVTLDDGSSINFDRLLIATGASPLPLPVPGADLAGVQQLWTLDHTAQLLDQTAGNEKPEVIMIGAGFIGFIMLNAMYKRGWNLSVVERESHVLPRMLDDGAATIVEGWLKGRGVDLHCGTSVQSIEEAGEKKKVNLENGTSLTADVVIVATGIQPNIGLAEAAGIETDTGILVNANMQTNFPNIFAGGDVAQGPVLGGGDRAIHAIQPTAVDHGRIAGANMAGHSVDYSGSLLMNVLDVCGLQTASFGEWSGEGTTISNDTTPVYRKLVWSGDQLVGAIFAGQANDLGMLTDVGMVKGILQTETALGDWRKYLEENPFDIRRAYVATGVAAQLAKTTLLGRPARAREYRVGGAAAQTSVGSGHSVFVADGPK